MLLIAALANALGEDELVEGFTKRKLRNYYLINPEETGQRHHKLMLTQTDKSTIIAIIDNRELPNDRSIRVEENFQLFETWISSRKGDLAAICHGLAKLVVVDVALCLGPLLVGHFFQHG